MQHRRRLWIAPHADPGNRERSRRIRADGRRSGFAYLAHLGRDVFSGRLVVPFLHFGTDVKVAALVMSFATLATFHAAGYSAVLRAFEDNELVYFGFVLHKVLLLGFVFLSIKLQIGLLGFVVAHLVVERAALEFLPPRGVTLLLPHYRCALSVPLWKSLIVSALPMGGGVMLRQLALQLDILVLTWMTNLTTVGYSVVLIRISMALRMIPQDSLIAALSALFPHRPFLSRSL